MATVVQAVDGVASCANPTTVAYTSNVTIGNHLIVCIAADTAPPIASQVTDTRGNTYVRDATVTNGESVAVFSCKNVSTGANTVSVAYAPCKSIQLYEVSGLDATTWFDNAVTASGTSTAPATGSLTAAGAGFICSLVGWGTSTSCNAIGGAWSQHGFESESFGTMTGNSQYQANAGGGSFSFTHTLGTSARWSITLAAYKNAAAGGATQAQIWPSIQQGILNPMIGRRYV